LSRVGQGFFPRVALGICFRGPEENYGLCLLGKRGFCGGKTRLPPPGQGGQKLRDTQKGDTRGAVNPVVEFSKPPDFLANPAKFAFGWMNPENNGCVPKRCGGGEGLGGG